MSLQHLLVVIALVAFSVTAKDLVLPKKDNPPPDVTIHATNKTQVPGVHYVVDAVELLKEAYAVYTTDPERAKLYAELYTEKHNETVWNVVVGYTAAYINATWYVETSVTSSWQKKKGDNNNTPVLFLIFSSS